MRGTVWMTTVLSTSLLLAAIIACDEGLSSSPRTTSSVGAGAPPNRAAAPQNSNPATPASTQKSYTYDQLKLVNGGEITIKNEMQFSSRYANEEKYMKMFGRAHTNLVQQILNIGGMDGAVTYAGFADPAKTSEAYKTAQIPGNKPTKTALYGNYILLIQTNSDPAALEPFAKKVTETIDAKIK